MSAITNATPLIALAQINQFELLRHIFDEVIVPQSVYDEVVHRGLERLGARTIIKAKWLHIMSPSTRSTVESLLLGLDLGEVDVLLLAKEQKPEWVIIDERQGRPVAKVMGFSVKGTLGILFTAVLSDLISKAEALDDLHALINADIRISPQLQNWFKQELEGI